APGGWLLMEIGEDQAGPLASLMAAEGFVGIQSRRDGNEVERYIGGRRAAGPPPAPRAARWWRRARAPPARPPAPARAPGGPRPAWCGALLPAEPVVLDNVPALADVATMRSLLERLGAEIDGGPGGAARLRVQRVLSSEAPYELVSTMRASVLVLGPLLARSG